MSDSKRTVGQALVGLLSDYRITQVLGIPGTHSIELYRGLGSASITHHLPRHEQGAGFIADGYARASGHPAVCFVITGPGVTNLMTAMGQAWSDSVPMLVISPMNKPSASGDALGRLHEVDDQSALSREVSAASITAQTEAEVIAAIHQAFILFSTARPGPVHISVPIPLLRSSAQLDWVARPIGAMESPRRDDIIRVRDMLVAAESPVLLVGGGAKYAGEEVRELCDAYAMPVVTTIAGKGVIPENETYCLGCSQRLPGTQALLGNSDLLIALGSEMAETDHYTPDLLLPDNRVVVNIDDLHLRRNVGDGIAIKADAKAFAAALLSVSSSATDAREKLVQLACKTAINENVASLSETQQFHQAVLASIAKALSDDTVITTDMTQLAYTGNYVYPSQQPATWLHPAGFGTLGYAVPAAMGAALANNEQVVIAIVGDYGFQYSLQELALLSELQLPVVILLWNNNGLQQIADDMRNAGIPPVAVYPQNPDFEQLVGSYGIDYAQVDTLVAIDSAVSEASAAHRPCVIEIMEHAVRADWSRVPC